MENKEIFKRLDNFFIIVLSVLLFAGITVYFITRSNYTISVSVGDAELKLAVILIITVSLFLMKFVEGRIKNSNDEREKIYRFQSLTYFRLSLLLITNLLILVLYNISGEGLLLLIYFLLFLLCFAYRPLEKKFKVESESFK